MIRSIVGLWAAGLAAQSIITTKAGTDWVFPADGRAALQAPLGFVRGIHVDRGGNLYIADPDNRLVFRVDPQGTLRILAGNGATMSTNTSDGPARQRSLLSPSAVTVDPAGIVYFGDSFRILRLTPDGLQRQIAGGGGLTGAAAEGQPALTVRMSPTQIALDPAGNLLITDSNQHKVWRLAPNGTVRTVAGTGAAGFSGDGGPAAGAQLSSPSGIAVDAQGNIFIGDAGNLRIRQVTPAGTITTRYGVGTGGTFGENLPAATSALGESPNYLTFDSAGNLYFTGGGRVRRINPAGVIASVVNQTGASGFSGDGGPAADAALRFTGGLAVDAAGSLFIADGGNGRIRRVQGGIVNTVAGNGQFRIPAEGIPGTAAWLGRPTGLRFDPSGRLLILDSQLGAIRILSANGTLNEYPRAYGCRYCAPWGNPTDIAFDGAGNGYVVETAFLCALYRVTPAGAVTRLTNRGCAATNDGVTLANAGFTPPRGVAVDSANNIYISETPSHRVRKIGTDGLLTTLAGTGAAGFSGDGGPARNAQLNAPSKIWLDSDGSLLIADTSNHRVRRVDPQGIITTIAGNGTLTSTADNVAATATSVVAPLGVIRDRAGNLLISEQRGRVRQVNGQAIISTIAGSSVSGFGGDGGPPLQAFLAQPEGMAVDAAGNLHIADAGNARVRAILNTGGGSFTAAPDAISFGAARAGQNPPDQTLALTSATPGLAFTLEITGAPWLRASSTAGVLPAQLRLAADLAGLAPGNYSGSVRVNVPAATPPSRSIPVTLTVAAGDPPKLVLESPRFAFTFSRGAGPASAQLTVRNAGSGTMDFAASATGGAWLAVAPTSGNLGAGQSATVAVNVTPGSLAAGVYSGSVVVTSAATADRIATPVVMTITGSPRRILVSQTGLTFTAVAGGGTPLPQSLAVLNICDGAMTFAAAARTFAGGNWLTVTPGGGSVTQPFLEFAAVEVGINAAGLSPGDYYGQIRITAEGADNTPQTVSVVLNVLPAGSNPGPDVRPSGLVFTGLAGTTPGSQAVVVANPQSADVAFNSGRITDSGQSWFVHEPVAASIAGDQPARILVQPDFKDLTAGVRRGAITLLFADGSIRTVSLLTVVAPSVSGAEKGEPGRIYAGNCTPRNLLPQFTTLRQGFTAASLQPVTVEVRIVDDCGDAITTGAATLGFSNGDPRLNLNHIGNGTWTATWQPRNANQPQVRVSASVFVVRGAATLAGQTEIGGVLAGRANAPSVGAGAVVNAASYESGFLSPGGYVSLFGLGLATGVDQAQTVPLPTQLRDTEVLIGGRSLPLNYSSEGQINALVPYDLPVNSQQQVIVRRGETVSVPETVVVAAAQPAIYTQDQSGKGPGVIVRGVDNSVVTAANPAHAGEVVVLYANGLGAVDPPVASGAAAPAAGPLSRTVNPVTVTVGGQPARVDFAGLTPGFPGLYQLNVALPAGLTGTALEVVATVAGVASPPVTIAVR